MCSVDVKILLGALLLSSATVVAVYDDWVDLKGHFLGLYNRREILLRRVHPEHCPNVHQAISALAESFNLSTVVIYQGCGNAKQAAHTGTQPGNHTPHGVANSHTAGPSYCFLLHALNQHAASVKDEKLRATLHAFVEHTQRTVVDSHELTDVRLIRVWDALNVFLTQHSQLTSGIRQLHVPQWGFVHELDNTIVQIQRSRIYNTMHLGPHGLIARLHATYDTQAKYAKDAKKLIEDLTDVAQNDRRGERQKLPKMYPLLTAFVHKHPEVNRHLLQVQVLEWGSVKSWMMTAETVSVWLNAHEHNCGRNL